MVVSLTDLLSNESAAGIENASDFGGAELFVTIDYYVELAVRERQ